MVQNVVKVRLIIFYFSNFVHTFLLIVFTFIKNYEAYMTNMTESEDRPLIENLGFQAFVSSFCSVSIVSLGIADV